ncbi:MAG: serine protease [Xanthomonadales bacterium]|nr:serine protease [Xanthomonadales bacterium]
MLFNLVLLVLCCLAPSPARAADSAELVFANWKDRVVQVRLMDRAAGGKSGIGSGFFAGRDDWVVSNYHVIAGLVNEPGRFEARYVADDGSEGTLELLAVDVVHDLALLRTDGIRREPLVLADGLPPNGVRLWSMGYPFDIGLTIVEGTFNGPWQNTLYEKLHFTGSVNQGMSGGPALDASGQLVGVNVMGGFNQVSFLVPARHVGTLLQNAGDSPPGKAVIDAMVAAQLLENQSRLVARTLEGDTASTRLGDYSAPGALADFINCWGGSEEDLDSRLDFVYYGCQTRDEIFLADSLNTGSIRYQHEYISSESLEPLRFWRQLEDRGYYPRLELSGDEATVTNFRCQSGFVEGRTLPLKVTYCVRAYRKLDGLFDAYLTATSLVEDTRALQTRLALSGFSWESLERFTTAYLDGFQWTP